MRENNAPCRFSLIGIMKTFLSLPFLLIYGQLLALFCWRKGYIKMAQSLLIAMMLGLYLLCTPLMTTVLLTLLGKFPPITNGALLKEQGYQAIVVLSGGFYRGEEMHNQWQAGGYSLTRLRYAAHLARESQLPIIISGVEAPAMANTLIQDFGINAQWLEAKSKNTDENARFSRDVLRQQGIKKFVLVTDVWHMGRSQLAFAQYNLYPLAAPTDFPMGFYQKQPSLLQPKADLFLMNIFGVSECLGHIKYRVKYLFAKSNP